MTSTLGSAPSTLPQANESCWCGSGRKYKRCHKKSEGRILQGLITPMREVPANIARPPYADTGEYEAWDEGRVKSPEIIERMRASGKLAGEVLKMAGDMVKPGVTTETIDIAVHQAFIDGGAYPSTINYHGYPKACCTSVNEVICHGIPDSRELQEGDICNIDVTGWLDGVHGDTNATFFVGDVDPESQQLVNVTEESRWRGIEAVKVGRPLSDIGRAIEDTVKPYKYGVVRAFVGHGIGEQFHTEIQVLHYYDSRSSTIMRAGMTFTIEPMITLGTINYKIWDDDWTAVTSDGRRTAQFEHTLLVTDEGPQVLTGGPGTASPTAPWKR